MNSIFHNELESFQKSVKKLGTDISKADCLWRDAQFEALSASVRNVADQAKTVILNGERCENDIEQFLKISREKY